MSEEKITVSDKEVAAVEKEVKETEKAAEQSVEDRVRKEIAAEQKTKQLQDELETQKKAVALAEESAEKAKKESKELIDKEVTERLRQASEARSKIPVDTKNPFMGKEESKPVITPEQVSGIQDASFRALQRRSARR